MANKSIKVLYHKNCLDGFSASWAAWKKFKDEAEYIPVVHQMPVPEDLENKEIYFLDFIYPKEDTEKIRHKAKKVVAIDHHESEKETTKSIPDHLYDNDHSGAVLAWKYFHPDKPIPKLLKIVEDIDLWRFNIKETRPITTYLETIDFDFKRWNQIASDLENENKIKNYVEKGNLILKYKNSLVEKLTEKSQKVKFEGREILAVNSSILVSEVGNALYEKHPPFSIIWYRGDGVLKISMRSNGDVDVSKIAKKYGGGGHPAAASFKMSIEDKLPWKLTKNE